MNHRPTITNKRRQGALLSLELVIALPVLLIVVFASIEFSFLLLGSQAITAAASIGARQAALPSATAQDVNNSIFQALNTWRWAEPQHLQVLVYVDADDDGIETDDLVYDSHNAGSYDPLTDEVAAAPTGTDIQVTIVLPSNQAAPDLLSIFGLGLADQELSSTFVTRKE